jgi:mRNA interferase RelE/StbE
MASWRVVVMPEAKKHLAEIKDTKVQQGLKNALNRLKEDPDKRGKPLREDLIGFRGLRAVGERYRIIFQILDGKHEVHVVAVGMRREGSRTDIYHIMSQLVRSGIIQCEAA